MTKDPEIFFIDGCGRCSLFATPKCKVITWKEELAHLRAIVQGTGLVEECKWGMPCYTYEKHNVAMIAAFKEYCSLSFFKGALLKDTKKLLKEPGENSQAVRLFKFTNTKEVIKLAPTIKAYIKEAITLEKSGKKIAFKKIEEQPIPIEFQDVLEKKPAVKKAFNALTPGRQRGYLLFFSGAKQSATRIARIEKCVPDILKGKGMHD